MSQVRYQGTECEECLLRPGLLENDAVGHGSHWHFFLGERA